MPYLVSIDEARAKFPQYEFVSALTPSAQKAAFHVRDGDGSNLCLKLIAPNYGRDRLDREILALQSICHPNVVRLREYVFRSKGGEQSHYIIEDFIEGADLSDRLHPNQKWPAQEASAFFLSLSEGLSALGERNIVHRDLKPSNVRVRTDGTPIIIDFGLARHLDLPDLTNTEQGAAIGTPCYFAPEQFTGTKRDIDCRTDLFALGILMHQALVGNHPFWRENMPLADLREAICESGDFRSARDFMALPSPWRVLIGRLLEKERGNRPNHAAQVIAILRNTRTPA